MVKLASAGWGELAGWELRGLRHILQGLINCLDFRSGRGFSTIGEIATKASYSQRWTAHCLNELEELGIIDWRRGGVIAGKTQKSWFQINKTFLANLIRAARKTHSAVVAEYRRQTLERIHALKNKRLLRPRRSNHVALRTSISPLKGEASIGHASQPEQTITQNQAWRTDALCEHGFTIGKTRIGTWLCPVCRAEAAMVQPAVA